MRRKLLTAAAIFIAYVAHGATSTDDLSAVAVAHDAFQLTPTVTTITRQLPVDTTTILSLDLVAPSRTLAVTLVAPNAVRYTIGTPGPAFSSGIALLDTTDTKPGASYRAIVTNPMTGMWSLIVSETVPVNAPLEVVVSAFFNNTTRVILAGGDTYPVGANIRLAFVAFDRTTKLGGLALTGRLFRPFDPAYAPTAITFRDDGTAGDEIAGDRIYEALVNPGQVGTYDVQVDATGTASTGAFRRTAAISLRVVARDAQIINATDEGLDDDDDGLIDRVVISPAATITRAATYTVVVRLRGTNGHELQRSTVRAFTPGTGIAAVSFTAAEITRELAVDGPYTIGEVRYLEQTSSDLLPADIKYDLGVTAPYSLDGLQHARLRLSGRGSATGVDANNNHLYDTLHVAIGIIADYAGTYTGSVSLTDPHGREMGFASGSVFLDAGENTITIDFAGRPIGQNHVDGPYTLANLIFFGEDQSLLATTALITPAFRASQFEGYVVGKRHAVRR